MESLKRLASASSISCRMLCRARGICNRDPQIRFCEKKLADCKIACLQRRPRRCSKSSNSATRRGVLEPKTLPSLNRVSYNIRITRSEQITGSATYAREYADMSTTTVSTQTITAENVIRLFPDVNPDLAGVHRVPMDDRDLVGYDEEQIRLMEEVCIVLDNNDNPIGSASKKVCTSSCARQPYPSIY